MDSSGGPLKRRGSPFSVSPPPMIRAVSVRVSVSGLYWNSITCPGEPVGFTETMAPLSRRGELEKVVMLYDHFGLDMAIFSGLEYSGSDGCSFFFPVNSHSDGMPLRSSPAGNSDSMNSSFLSFGQSVASGGRYPFITIQCTASIASLKGCPGP